MKPYFEEDGIVIYHGDCREVMPTLESVDVVITDPPYADRTHKGALTNKLDNAPKGYRQGGAKLIAFDCFSDADFIEFSCSCLKVARRWVVMTCDHRHAALTTKLTASKRGSITDRKRLRRRKSKRLSRPQRPLSSKSTCLPARIG